MAVADPPAAPGLAPVWTVARPQPTRREGPSPPPRVAVLRALPGVGDLLCAVPALRAMRHAWPAAHVTLLGLPQSAWFVQRFGHLVDDLLPVEGVAGLPEVDPDARAAQRFRATVRQRRFDLALQAHGSGEVTNRLLVTLGARHLVTSHVHGHWQPPGTSVHYPEGPEVLRLLRLVAAAGCTPHGLHLELPLGRADVQSAHRLLRQTWPAGRAAESRGFVCLHPGASISSRRWPASRFAAVADELVQQGLGVVVTGSAGERPVARAVIGAMAQRHAVLDLSGRTSIGELGALFRSARLVVTNDTGASHVADAVDAPSVVVTSAADPWRWAPLDAVRHVVVAGTAMTGGRDQGWPRWPPVAAVAGAVTAQLERGRSSP
jgi:ADP-heptose:LPS heptosyltransferase